HDRPGGPDRLGVAARIPPHPHPHRCCGRTRGAPVLTAVLLRHARAGSTATVAAHQPGDTGAAAAAGRELLGAAARSQPAPAASQSYWAGWAVMLAVPALGVVALMASVSVAGLPTWFTSLSVLGAGLAYGWARHRNPVPGAASWVPVTLVLLALRLPGPI